MQKSRWRTLRRIALVVLLLGVGLVAYNWTLLTHPQLIASKLLLLWNERMQEGPFTYWWGDLVRTVEVEGNTAYVGLGTRLGVVDVSDPRNPKLVRTVDLQGIVHGFTLRDNVLFCAHGASGMSTFDVSNPVDPIRVGKFAFPGYGMHVAPLKDNHVLFSNEAGGWFVLDVSDPATLVPVFHAPGGWINAARVIGVRTVGESSSDFEVESVLFDLRAERRLTQNLVLNAQSGWWRQESTSGRSLSGGDDGRTIDDLRFQVGFTWSFDRIEF